MNEQFKITGCENYKWFQFKNLTYGQYCGSEYKRQLLNDIFADITWNVCKVVYRNIPNMLFHAQKMLPPFTHKSIHVVLRGDTMGYRSLFVVIHSQ